METLVNMKAGSAPVLLICMAASGSAAHAGALLVSDERRLEVLASATDDVVQYETVGPLNASAMFGEPFEWALDTGEVAVPNGQARARAAASQESSFNAAPMLTAFSAAADATTSLNRFGETVAISELVIQFHVATPQDWSIDASIFTTTNSFGASSFVQLREVGEADLIFSLDGAGDQSDAVVGTLLPGEYELAARAVCSVRPVRPSMPTRLARFEFEIIIVPEPTTAALLMASSAVIVCRSRRKKRLSHNTREIGIGSV